MDFHFMNRPLFPNHSTPIIPVFFRTFSTLLPQIPIFFTLFSMPTNSYSY